MTLVSLSYADQKQAKNTLGGWTFGLIQDPSLFAEKRTNLSSRALPNFDIRPCLTEPHFTC